MKIKEAREAAGYTQEKLVYRINNSMNCSLRNYQNIEYGTVIPNVTLALLIAHLLEVDPREIDEWKFKWDKDL
ncbi:helix-turn-helix transcriptional regulator [Paenibacillus senegalimassiliensis]|uniref:helix-turn-helix transcriptional regulator n=1 Tax=Paenibacillus senegalimassiliensis TaxID=1737426 RepID=UPI00073EC85F|nr:helix-turn-helix transcriptional regulator [Paenibacillus senegalimassiliensis]